MSWEETKRRGRMTSTGTDAKNNTYAKGVLEAGGGRLWVLTEARSQREQRGGNGITSEKPTLFVRTVAHCRRPRRRL